MRRETIVALSLLSALAATSAVASGQVNDEWPKAVEQEMNEAVRRSAAAAKAIAGDHARYLIAAAPYGPLDLSLGRAVPNVRPAECRRFFQGAIALGAGPDRDQLRKIIERVRCGAACYEEERRRLQASLSEARAVFTIVGGGGAHVKVVALWPDGAYRVDRIVVEPRGVFELVGSPQLDAVPWERRLVAKSANDALKAFALGLLYFDWQPLPAQPLLYLHLFLVAVLMAIFPYSKLLHAPGVFFSPGRNQSDNPREQRHLAPWAAELEKGKV